jgi:predicted flap endonuclease-1-like 5' DNA nuclease
MQLECWPAQPDSVNLARFIWQPVDYVFTELRNLGFDEIRTEPFAFNNVINIKEQLNNDQLFTPQMESRSTSALVIYFYDDNCEQGRVVSFKVGPRPKRTALEPDTLPTDDPALDVRRVPGIGDGIAKRLKASGIENLRDLGAADPATIKEALSTIPINAPNEARSELYINEARELLDNLKKGT